MSLLLLRRTDRHDHEGASYGSGYARDPACGEEVEVTYVVGFCGDGQLGRLLGEVA